MGRYQKEQNDAAFARKAVMSTPKVIETFSITSENTNIDSKLPQTQPADIMQKRTLKVQCLGFSYALISGVLFSLCAATVKYVDDVDPGQVAFYQYIAIFVFSLPMVIHARKNPLGPTKTTKYWMILCGAFDAVTIYLSFMSFRYLPLADASVLTSTVPVFVTISARIFLKETCGTAQILAIVITVFGVTLVTKLPLVLSERTEVYSKESIIGVAASLGSITTECGIYIILRKLHDVNVFVILLNFGWVALIVDGILTAIFGKFVLTTCGFQQWLLIAVGVFSFLSQMTLAKALETEEAGPVSVLMTAGDIIVAFILDIILFYDHPDSYTMGGTALIVSSVIIVGFKNLLNDAGKRFAGRKKKFKVMC